MFLIEKSSQIDVDDCGYFSDKVMRMYYIANAVGSVGYTIDVNDSFLPFVEMSSDVFA